MDNTVVIRALKGNATSLNLSTKKIYHVPKSASKLINLSILLLNNNYISTLPIELQSLENLTELNLGNNSLKEIPPVIGYLHSLKKLYLFGNYIDTLTSSLIGVLPNLVLLNLNHNYVRVLPPEIKGLVNLEVLSLLDNRLEKVPVELGQLKKMVEINFTNNQLSWIPPQLYCLSQLTKLYLARNRLAELPEGITRLSHLKVLDVAGNMLTMFPVNFQFMALKDLQCEGNNFVPQQLMVSEQTIEVLSLKELCARLILLEERKKVSVVHKGLLHQPAMASLLSQWGCCALCSHPFLTTWLECVQFVNVCKYMKMKNSLTIPVRAPLCSYQCFNKSGHSYYGVVLP